MTEFIKKLMKIAPDEKFKEIIAYLTATQSPENPENYMYMVLTLLSMPQYANTYRFLINLDKHELQRIYEERTLNVAQQKTNDLLGDFVNKVTIWADLEK